MTEQNETNFDLILDYPDPQNNIKSQNKLNMLQKLATLLVILFATTVKK